MNAMICFIAILLYDQHKVLPSVARRFCFRGRRFANGQSVNNQREVVATRWQEQRAHPISATSRAHWSDDLIPIVESSRKADAMSASVLEFEQDAPQV
jgi:hypothetical protein